ncbi:ArdC family protein [Streptobacillus moniliformis]|uniref:ArdC family protein n=1 Tax=Streptobacillus moniliformis TaxID=34105 RepID=UPI0007E427D4|nr:zincin-like metallopeptidase domain-containing protein [Streptobacillus moniliformis]
MKEKKDIHEILKESRLAVLDEIVKAIDKDPLNWSKGWNPSMVAPFNPITNNYYSGGNVLKAAITSKELESEDPRWLTFLQIKEAGLKLKKGASSIQMEYWSFTKEELTDEKIKRLDEKEIKRIENKIESRIKKGWRFEDSFGSKIELPIDRHSKYFNLVAKQVENTPLPGYFNVFNGKDIEGLEEFKYPELEESDLWDIADDFIASCPVKVIESAQDRAFASSDLVTKKSIEIVLPPRETFKNSREFLATLLHEMGHETGSEDLKRNKSGSFGSLDYAKEELVAEFTSIMVQGRLGIELGENGKSNHTAYLQNWIKVIKEKTYEDNYKPENELFRALSEASKSSNLIMERYKEKRKELGKEYVDILELNSSKQKEKESPWDIKKDDKELER